MVMLLVLTHCSSCAKTHPSTALFQSCNTTLLRTSFLGKQGSGEGGSRCPYRTSQCAAVTARVTSHNLCPLRPSTSQLLGFRVSSSQRYCARKSWAGILRMLWFHMTGWARLDHSKPNLLQRHLEVPGILILCLLFFPYSSLSHPARGYLQF